MGCEKVCVDGVRGAANEIFGGGSEAMSGRNGKIVMFGMKNNFLQAK